MKRIILLIILLGLLGGGLYVYQMSNKEHINVAETEAAETLSASDIFSEFDGNESLAMETYADKVIQVSGMVTTVDLSNDLEPQLVLEGNGDNGFVRCGFKISELSKVEAVKDSTTVTLKGECKGLNGSDGLDLLADKDVVLSNCIIIE
jgi:hypothetical protein